MCRIVLVAVSMLAGLANCWAGTLEDAQKLLEEKKYDEVDKALDKLLAQKDVPVQALKISLEAAVARGRVITAQQRVTALLKATQNQDLPSVYLGATLAEQVGDERTALGRYLAYGKAKNDKDEKVEQALRYVLARGPYPEEYAKYVALFGKNDVSWTLGARQAAALFAGDESSQAYALCETLLAAYASPAQVTHVHWLLWDASEKGQLGNDPEQRWLRPLDLMLKYHPDNLTYVENFIVNRLFAWDKCPVEVRADRLLKAQDVWKGRLSWNLLSRFGVLREIPEENRRLDFGRRYLANEPLYKNDPDPNAYREYLTDVMQSPQVYFVQGKELISTADMLARFELIAKNFGSDQAVMTHFLNHMTGSYMRDDPARVDFLKKHLSILVPDKVAWLIGATKGENMEGLIAEASKGKDGNWICVLNGSLMPVLSQLGKKDALLMATRGWASAQPGTFGWQHLQAQFMNCAAVTVDEKLAFLREMLDKGGASPPLKALVAELDKDKKNWSPNPHFQMLRQELNDSHKAGSDRLMSAHVKLYSLPWNQGHPPQEYYETASKLLEDFKDPIPTGNPLQDTLLGGICGRHFEAVWNSRNDLEKAARLWAPRLKQSFFWAPMTQ
ncbi:MAG: hypothetical protein ABSE73_10110, partial [Planctomycetota bacterium]